MKMGLLLMICLAALFAAAQNLDYQPDPSWKAPAKAAEKANPLKDKPNALAGGKRVFASHCAECHGEDGRGIGKAADLTQAQVQQQSDGALFWKITNGHVRRGMPSFSAIPDLQRWQLVLAIRSLQAP